MAQRWGAVATKFFEEFLYLGRESCDSGGGLGAPGANKRTGTCLCEGAAACRTCHFAGIIESSNFVRKSMPIMGVATAARKKSNSNSWPAKETIWRQLPQTGTMFPFAPTRCGPVGDAELECGRIEIEAPESTKKFRLLFVSFKKIRFLVGNADIAVTNSGIARGGGRQAGIGPAAAAKCGPAAGLLVFLVGAALLALVGLVAEAGVVETQTVVAAALGCPGSGRAAAARFVGRLVAAGRLTAVRRGGSAGVPKSRMLPRRRRKRPPRGSGTSTVRCNAVSYPPWCRRTAC